MATYKIVRHYRNGVPNEVVTEGLTLEQAQAWCSDPETSSATCTSPFGISHTKLFGPWFDSFQKEQ